MLGGLAAVEIHFITFLLGEITALWWPFRAAPVRQCETKFIVLLNGNSSVHQSIYPLIDTSVYHQASTQIPLDKPALSSTTSFKCFLDLSMVLFVPVTLPQESLLLSAWSWLWGLMALITFSPGQRQWQGHPEELGLTHLYLLYGHFAELMIVCGVGERISE